MSPFTDLEGACIHSYSLCFKNR